eukprot:1138230-Pelagomonas_calceolata.AAC.5
MSITPRMGQASPGLRKERISQTGQCQLRPHSVQHKSRHLANTPTNKSPMKPSGNYIAVQYQFKRSIH